MKALVYKGEKYLDYTDWETPKPAENEVLVKVCSVGICGSDMHAYFGHDERRPPPLILGHEAAGIAESGKYANKYVSVNPLITCGQCDYCRQGKDNLCYSRNIISIAPRQGAFAEWVSVPEENLIEIAGDVPFHIACLIEPLATGYHAISLLNKSFERPLDEANILIIGGGAIGIGCLEILLGMGINQNSITLTEKNALRRDKAAELFNCHIRKPEEIAGNAESKFNLILDAVGNHATHGLSTFAATPGGHIVRIGLEKIDTGYDIRKMTLQEITLMGSYTYTKYDFQKTAALFFKKRIGNFEWTTEMPLQDGAAAFNLIANGETPYAKISLKVE